MLVQMYCSSEYRGCGVRAGADDALKNAPPKENLLSQRTELYTERIFKREREKERERGGGASK